MTIKTAVHRLASFISITAVAATLIASIAACSPEQNGTPKTAAKTATNSWPERQIDIVVYSSAGGSTDLTNRVLASAMEEHLGTNVSVVNMPGALGGTAVNYVWNQPHDGYRLTGISEGALAHAPLGLIKTTSKDWDWYMLGGTPGVISVRSDSPYTDFSQLLEAIVSNSDKPSIATSVPGSIWHIQWLNTKNLGGFDTRFIPFAGSQPSQVAALTGEVDIVWTGLGEQAELIKGNRLRPLAVFSPETVVINGQTIPAITDYIPEVANVMPLDQFVGFAIPDDTPEFVKKQLNAAFSSAMKSEAVAEFATTKFVTLTGLSGEAARQVALTQEWKMAKTLEHVGLAKKTTTELGITTQ